MIGILNQLSSNSNHEVKQYQSSNSSTKMRKNEKMEKFFSGLQNGAFMGLQIGANFGDYKSGQEGLQIGTA